MTPIHPLNRKDTVYPGEYVPRTGMENCFNRLCSNADAAVSETPVNMLEDEDCFHLSLEMPGLKRDDILIFVHDHILSVSVHPQTAGLPENDQAPEAESNAHILERHIRLPEAADAEYISAEYRNGFLMLFISKNPSGSRINNRQVVVY